MARPLLQLLLFICLAFFNLSAIGLCAISPGLSTNGEQQLSIYDRVETALNQLSLEEKIGQLFIVTADGSAEQLADMSRNYHWGGYIFFTRHAPSLIETMERIEKIQSVSDIFPFIAIDQEGGRVARLSFLTPIPAAASLSSLSPESVHNIAELMAKELRLIGFNLNFAPVMDVNTFHGNPVIGDRAFSHDPYIVAQLGTAFIQGLQKNHVAAACKHFPGHGDTRLDSHYALPTVFLSTERLDQVEILPFRSAVLHNSALIMTAHVHYPALDPLANRPASLSYPIVTQLLRKELGYEGIIITDALNMQAITRHFSVGAAAVTAFRAGVDLLLMPQNPNEAYLALLNSVRQGDIPLDRLNDSVRRILRLKYWLKEDNYRYLPFSARLAFARAEIASPKHRQLMKSFLSNQQHSGETQN